jgi:hypothetical protein
MSNNQLILWDTGGGCTGFTVTDDQDAPGLYALITCDDDPSAPESPETERMAFGVYDENGQAVGPVEFIEGRKGLNDWYFDSIGYRPDEESLRAGGPLLPIHELMRDVAECMLVEAYQDHYHARNSRS